MKKAVYKAISLVLVATLLFSVLPTTVFTVAGASSGASHEGVHTHSLNSLPWSSADDFDYIINGDDDAEITGYHGSDFTSSQSLP